MDLLEQSTRIAIAAFLHDLGKLAERAGIETGGRLDGNKQTYCPWRALSPNSTSGYHSHVHAAYTGVAWDELEATRHFPDLRRNAPPFAAAASENVTDSAVNAAAAHHKPATFLQWVVATADRVASGFERENFDEYNNANERKNHYQARLLTLFEQMDAGSVAEDSLAWRYSLKPLAPQNIFPLKKAEAEPQDNETAKAEYHHLWEALLDGIKKIPRSHLDNLPLWLDHFDSLWLTLTHAIPAATAFGVKPEVSLYDHSKAAAALGTALWRWHQANGQENPEALKGREGWDVKKFLLIQGEFSGIQEFIFTDGAETQKHAHKLLRGRSFQVSLLAECAALKVLVSLELPSTSQIINAAGKFMIVAPATDDARNKIAQCRRELNTWCLEQTFGEIGVGLATVEASCNDFAKKHFGQLVKRLFEELDVAKHQRFDLCAQDTPRAFTGYLDKFNNHLKQCRINPHHPADDKASIAREYSISRLADDQIRIGESLTKGARLLALRDATTYPNALALDYFGYRIAFATDQDQSGKFGQDARDNNLVRCWDFDAPDADGNLWRGYARRFVNAYVPVWNETDQTLADHGRYKRVGDDARGETTSGNIKTLHAIACEDGHDPNGDGKYVGEIALVTIKGDIDNLGQLLQTGLKEPTFAKMASLSRQINAFFAIWLPWYCEHGDTGDGIKRFRNTYTVFAGGDDFFLIGPWESTIRLAGEMRARFADYVANPRITFSAGMVMSHPDTPLRQLAQKAEAALATAKAFQEKAMQSQSKDAAHLWGHTCTWQGWRELMNIRLPKLEALMERSKDAQATFSTGLTYSLLQLAGRTESERPEHAIWASQLHYRLARFYLDRVRGGAHAKDKREGLLRDALAEIGGALRTHRTGYRLPLSILLYRQRD